MNGLKNTTNLLRVLTVCAIPVLLYGCGGGGGVSPANVNDVMSTKGQPSSQTTASTPSATSSSAISTTTSDNRSVRLNSYNNYWFKNDQGWSTNEMLQVQARKDSILTTESWPVSAPSAMKAINPRAKVYCYYTLSAKTFNDVDGAMPDGTVQQRNPVSKALIDSNDWWLRDGNGQVIEEMSNCWFVDVGKPGYKEAFLSSLLTRLAGRNLDGVIFDYWTPGLQTGYIAGFFKNRPLPAAYPTDQDFFTKAWQPFIEYVMTGVRQAGYRVIGNCAGEYNSGNARSDWQRQYVDGTVYEQFAVDWPNRGGNWLSGSTINNRINHFANDPLEAWSADYGLSMADPLYSQKLNASLAMYYIAIPMSQANRSYGEYGNCKIFWESIWDVQIGVPSASFVKKSANYFWSRKYTQGLVLLNYEADATISYKLDRAYYTPDGNKLKGTISVPPHTGLILTTES